MCKFEILAKLHGLDVSKNEHNYLNPKTELARTFWDAQQVEIDKIKQELFDVTFEAKAFKYVLDNQDNKTAKSKPILKNIQLPNPFRYLVIALAVIGFLIYLNIA